MTDRVRGFVNVYQCGTGNYFYETREQIDGVAEVDRVRTAEVVELPEWASVVTREMREKITEIIESHRRNAVDPIASYDSSLRSQSMNDAAQKVLDILDGKDGA